MFIDCERCVQTMRKYQERDAIEQIWIRIMIIENRLTKLEENNK